jgi:hypothetical protein
VTLFTSLRTSCRNLNGDVRAMPSEARALI